MSVSSVTERESVQVIPCPYIAVAEIFGLTARPSNLQTREYEVYEQVPAATAVQALKAPCGPRLDPPSLSQERTSSNKLSYFSASSATRKTHCEALHKLMNVQSS